MKILLDSQIFDEQKYGGISRYFVELFKNLNNINDIECKLPIRNSINKYLREVEFFRKRNLSPHFLSNVKGKFFLYNFLDIFDKNSNRNLIKKKLKEQNFDIFHPTYYATYFLKYLKNKKFVLTVYDMTLELFPQYSCRASVKTIESKKALISRADKIIAISENTKKDILNFCDIPEEKIKVIYLANSLMPVNGRPAGVSELPEKYILFVGARGFQKNFNYFIKSISPILKNDKSLNVIVAGGYTGKNSFSKEEKSLFAELQIEKQIAQYSPNDEGLAYLYQNATCFVFPSLYEGFGIPVLEAFACDCPAVISNASSLPEIGGNAAIYFNPTDGNSILKAVEKVLYNKDLRQQMILAGREQLKKFSWGKTARETLDLYSDLL